MKSFGALTLGELAGQRWVPPATTARVGDRPGPRDAEGHVDALLAETVSLSRGMRATSERVHGQGGLSAGRRDLLRELERQGPQTVPQMARARSVTRQHIQALVSPLAEAGYLEFVDNPAHKRSPLVRVTRRGKEFVEAVNRREARLMARLERAVGDSDLRYAAAVLRALREALEAV